MWQRLGFFALGSVGFLFTLWNGLTSALFGGVFLLCSFVLFLESFRDFEFLKKMFLVVQITGKDSSLHFRRWRILSTPWFNVFVHRIYHNDEDADCHSHPWSFISFILNGKYKEKRMIWDGGRFLNGPQKWFSRFSILKRPSGEFHKIVDLEGPVTTLVITGPSRSTWGFQTENGYLKHEEYLKWKNEHGKAYVEVSE